MTETKTESNKSSQQVAEYVTKHGVVTESGDIVTIKLDKSDFVKINDELGVTKEVIEAYQTAESAIVSGAGIAAANHLVSKIKGCKTKEEASKLVARVKVNTGVGITKIEAHAVRHSNNPHDPATKIEVVGKLRATYDTAKRFDKEAVAHSKSLVEKALQQFK